VAAYSLCHRCPGPCRVSAACPALDLVEAAALRLATEISAQRGQDCRWRSLLRAAVAEAVRAGARESEVARAVLAGVPDPGLRAKVQNLLNGGE
jgi:hypothetical protein